MAAAVLALVRWTKIAVDECLKLSTGTKLGVFWSAMIIIPRSPFLK